MTGYWDPDRERRRKIDRNDRVVWVAVDSPKLQELFDKAVPFIKTQ